MLLDNFKSRGQNFALSCLKMFDPFGLAISGAKCKTELWLIYHIFGSFPSERFPFPSRADHCFAARRTLNPRLTGASTASQSKNQEDSLSRKPEGKVRLDEEVVLYRLINYNPQDSALTFNCTLLCPWFASSSEAEISPLQDGHINPVLDMVICCCRGLRPSHQRIRARRATRLGPKEGGVMVGLELVTLGSKIFTLTWVNFERQQLAWREANRRPQVYGEFNTDKLKSKKHWIHGLLLSHI